MEKNIRDHQRNSAKTWCSPAPKGSGPFDSITRISTGIWVRVKHISEYLLDLVDDGKRHWAAPNPGDLS